MAAIPPVRQTFLSRTPIIQERWIFPPLSKLKILEYSASDAGSMTWVAQEILDKKFRFDPKVCYQPRYLVKWHVNPAFLESRFHASRAYEAFGLRVVPAHLYKGEHFGGQSGNFLITTCLEGHKSFAKVMKGCKEKDADLLKALQRDFVALCVLGAGEPIGPYYDHVTVSPEGDIIYTNLAASLGFCYDGTPKADAQSVGDAGLLCDVFGITKHPRESEDDYAAWQKKIWWSLDAGGIVPELVHLRDPTWHLAEDYVYGDLTTAEIQDQINALDPTCAVLEALVKTEEFPPYLFSILHQRVCWLKTLSLEALGDLESRGGVNSLRQKRLQRQAALEEAYARLPVFATATPQIEPLAAARCGCFLDELKGLRYPRPPKEGVLYQEIDGSFWLQKDPVSEVYSLPTWRLSHVGQLQDPVPLSVPVDHVLGPNVCVKARAKYIQTANGTHYYSATRLGGIPDPRYVRCSAEEASARLTGADLEALESYLIQTGKKSLILLREDFAKRASSEAEERYKWKRICALQGDGLTLEQAESAFVKESQGRVASSYVNQAFQAALSQFDDRDFYVRQLLKVLKDPTQIATFEKHYDHRWALISFYSPRSPTAFQDPHAENIRTVGIVIKLHDQRVVMVSSDDQVPLFPQGVLQEGEDCTQAAVRIAKERMGFDVQLVSVIGNYPSGIALTRFYQAVPVNGDPAEAGFLTRWIYFVPVRDADESLAIYQRESLRRVLAQVPNS